MQNPTLPQGIGLGAGPGTALSALEGAAIYIT